MATYTPNYGLHQWVPEDDFLRSDFNEDLSKLDSTIKAVEDLANGKITCITGKYTGNDSMGESGGVWLTFPFVPKLVIVHPVDVNYMGAIRYLIMQSPDTQAYTFDTDFILHLVWSENSLHFYGALGESPSVYFNEMSCVYDYCAFG